MVMLRALSTRETFEKKKQLISMVSTGVYNGRIGFGGAADLVPGGSAAAMGVVRVAFFALGPTNPAVPSSYHERVAAAWQLTDDVRTRQRPPTTIQLQYQKYAGVTSNLRKRCRSFPQQCVAQAGR